MFLIVRGPDLIHACTTEYSNMYLTRLPVSTPHPLTTTCVHDLLMGGVQFVQCRCWQVVASAQSVGFGELCGASRTLRGTGRGATTFRCRPSRAPPPRLARDLQRYCPSRCVAENVMPGWALGGVHVGHEDFGGN